MMAQMVAARMVAVAAVSEARRRHGGLFGGDSEVASVVSTTTRVPLTSTMRTWAPWAIGRPDFETAPHTSPWVLTRPRRSVSSGSIALVTMPVRPTRRSAPTPRLQFVLADEGLHVSVERDPDQGPTTDEHEPLDLDRDVVEPEERRCERRDGERQQHERSGEHRELDQGEENGDAEPDPWPEVQVDPEVQHAFNLADPVCVAIRVTRPTQIRTQTHQPAAPRLRCENVR
jgi:hypothetical protein